MTDFPSPPSSAPTCGKVAVNLVPRLGMAYACVLTASHNGSCLPGGRCVEHGPYIGKAGQTPTCPKCTPSSASVPSDKTRRTGPGIGMPTALYLDEFGAVLHDFFGEYAYHVGSSLSWKDGWRDVDVRLLLPDDEYERLGFGDPENPLSNPRWVALVKAFTALGRQMTGLPIDFQIQQRTRANAKYVGGRGALGVHFAMRTGRIT